MACVPAWARVGCLGYVGLVASLINSSLVRYFPGLFAFFALLLGLLDSVCYSQLGG